MDFATEQKLCRHADEVWRRVAAEPDATSGCAAGAAKPADASCDVLDALHLQEVFALDTHDMLAW